LHSREFSASWSRNREIVEGYAKKYPTAGGGVVLQMTAPPAAIISAALLSHCDRHQEILVDHRQLRGVCVSVVKRFSERDVQLAIRRRQLKTLTKIRRIEARETVFTPTISATRRAALSSTISPCPPRGGQT
jgi:hypothetical protein